MIHACTWIIVVALFMWLCSWEQCVIVQLCLVERLVRNNGRVYKIICFRKLVLLL